MSAVPQGSPARLEVAIPDSRCHGVGNNEHLECDMGKTNRIGRSQSVFVAGELCCRRLVAVVTLGNCPNTDVLVSNQAGTHFAHVPKTLPAWGG